MTFSGEINVGHILTIATVLVSVVALIRAWRLDIRARERLVADRIRNAAALTLGRLERRKELALWYYDEIQPYLIEVSDSLQDSFDVATARDLLWQRLMTARQSSAERILKEDVEGSYVELYAYQPRLFGTFTSTIAALKASDTNVYGRFLEGAQANVLSWDDRERDYVPALLGDDLRATCFAAQGELEAELEDVVRPMREFALKTIAKPDAELLHGDLATPPAVGHSGQT